MLHSNGRGAGVKGQGRRAVAVNEGKNRIYAKLLQRLSYLQLTNGSTCTSGPANALQPLAARRAREAKNKV